MGETVFDIVIMLVLVAMSVSCVNSEDIRHDKWEETADGCELGKVYPHPDDCHQFYKCADRMGKPELELRTCFGGDIFDPRLNTCHPEDPMERCQPDANPSRYFKVISNKKEVECNTSLGLQSLCLNCTIYTFCSPVTDIWYYGSCPGDKFCNNFTTPQQCTEDVPSCVPFQCGEAGIFPDPNDCTVYHICDNDLHDFLTGCDNGKAYNPGTQTCDRPMPANPKECEAPIFSTNCPSLDSKLDISGDCLQYGSCDFSDKYPEMILPAMRSCGTGQFFIPTSARNNGSCVDLNMTQTPPDDACKIQLADSGWRCFEEGWQVYPDKNVCPTVGYACSASLEVSYVFPCDDGYAFNAENISDVCQNIEDVPSCQKYCSYIKGNLSRNVDNCSKYFVCHSNISVPEVHTCPDGLVFNDAIEECDDVMNVPRCINGYTTPTELSTTNRPTFTIFPSKTTNSTNTSLTPAQTPIKKATIP